MFSPLYEHGKFGYIFRRTRTWGRFNQENAMSEENSTGSLARRLQMRRADQSMARAQTQSKKQQDYAGVLIENLRENGQLVLVSDDMAFTTSLRDLVGKTLKMPQSCVAVNSTADNIMLAARQAMENKKRPLFLVEQNLKGRDLTYIIKLLKNAFPEIKVIILAKETDRQRFVLMHESGVDGCIVKPAEGQALLEKISQTIRPNDQLDRTLEWARVLLAQKEHLRALQVCTQALELQANSSAVFILMGDIFRAMKEYDKAIEAYGKAMSGSTIYLDPLRKMAELYAETGDVKKQIECLEKMDEVSPLNLERKIQIGELLLRLKQPDRARKMFDSAMKLSNRQARENVSGVAYRVADLYSAVDPDMAASFLQRGLDARKEFWGLEDIATFNRLGLLLRRMGKWQEAAEAYLKAISVAPNDETLHYNLAMARLEGKEIEGARASTLKALALNPDLPKKSSRIASNLAAVFMSSNDKMHALPLLRTALEQDPENSEAKELLARAESE